MRGQGEDTSERMELGVEEAGGISGKASGGVEARRRESEVSDATRPSNTQPPGVGEMWNVDQPHPGTGEARSRGPDLLAVIAGCNLGSERGWPESLPQDDNDGRDISRRYGIDPDTTNSRLQSPSCGPVNMEQFSGAHGASKIHVNGPSEGVMTAFAILCSRVTTRSWRAEDSSMVWDRRISSSSRSILTTSTSFTYAHKISFA